MGKRQKEIVRKSFAKCGRNGATLVAAAMLAAATATAETNLAPMLEVGVTVPNGGILRLFPRVTMKEKTQRELVKTFDESPYKDVQRALLNAFSTWLDGNVTGTQIKRRDVVYGIEMRYFGYWGEGAVKNGSYPVTGVFDGYIDAYLSAFPDIPLIAPMQETLHLPSRKNYDAHPTAPIFSARSRPTRGSDKRGPPGFQYACMMFSARRK